MIDGITTLVARHRDKHVRYVIAVDIYASWRKPPILVKP